MNWSFMRSNTRMLLYDGDMKLKRSAGSQLLAKLPALSQRVQPNSHHYRHWLFVDELDLKRDRCGYFTNQPTDKAVLIITWMRYFMSWFIRKSTTLKIWKSRKNSWYIEHEEDPPKNCCGATPVLNYQLWQFLSRGNEPRSPFMFPQLRRRENLRYNLQNWTITEIDSKSFHPYWPVKTVVMRICQIQTVPLATDIYHRFALLKIWGLTLFWFRQILIWVHLKCKCAISAHKNNR